MGPDLRRAPVVSGAARNHFALWRIWLCALTTSPLWRSSIGFDRLFDLAETAQRAGEDNYPPYNIERLAEDRYQITLAVAGFSPNEIAVTAEQNVVTIQGSKAARANASTSIVVFRHVPSSASSTLPTTCK